MIVLRKGLLIFIGALSIVIILGLGITGLLIIRGTGAVSIAEMYLFWAVIAAVFLLLIFLSTITRAQSLNRRLDRLIEQGNRRDIAPGRDFLTLGSLGDHLTTIFNQVSRQNALKSQKISAMHDLIEFLVRNEDQPVSVCDILGNIQYASEAMSTYLELDRVDFIGKNLNNLLPQVLFSELRSNIILTRQPSTIESGDRNFTCYPIEDKTDEVAYLVFLFNSKAQFFKTLEKTSVITQKSTSMLINKLSWMRNRKGR